MAVLERWVEDLVMSWEKRDVEAALRLFKNCTNYRETPFSANAALSPDGIRNLWEEVQKQSDIQVQTKIRLQSSNALLVEYQSSYQAQGVKSRSRGVWLVAFEDQQCTSFEQWYMPAVD
ncbi:hypothetical protein ABIF74_011804 [Bradyrhizobium japonicum]